MNFSKLISQYSKIVRLGNKIIKFNEYTKNKKYPNVKSKYPDRIIAENMIIDFNNTVNESIIHHKKFEKVFKNI